MENQILKISLAAARVNAELTQDAVAKELHIDKATLIKWEKGRVSPRASSLVALSRLYGISLDNIRLPEMTT